MNHLSGEVSPYLLQHAGNPVDWHPWGAEAFARAQSEQKPVFLSVGYSACHWCHVMAHESFENPEIARVLNDDFVSIKVDREERPDLDQIYMEAVQALAGQGGWPLSAFLTPDQKPFFGGTYWPAKSRGGMVGFDEVLAAVARAWRDHRNKVYAQADKAVRFLGVDRLAGGSTAELTERPLEEAEAELGRSCDLRLGGFGPAPKFPHATDLTLLLHRFRYSGRDDLLQMVTVTLDRMAAGGIYDQLGGGFHRYSVDSKWLVPHFEKMLYDNAMLAGCYLEAWQTTERSDYARVTRETLDYVLRRMTDPRGGFLSAEDADSEGEEGRYYLWTPQQVEQVLGPERARTFCQVYDVSEAGNFEGRNILHLPKPLAECAKILGRDTSVLEAELTDDRACLSNARDRRIRPGRDDKVLTSWNGLMIDVMARAGAMLNEPRYRAAAAAAADFLLQELRDDSGRLMHCWRAGRAKHGALLDDHASLANALITLHQVQPSDRWLDEATGLADAILDRFADPQHGGFFYTPIDHEPLIARKKDLWDSPVPSSTGMAVTALLRLARLVDRDEYRRAAQSALQTCVAWMQEAPLASGQLLLALDMLLHEDEPLAA